MSKQGKLVKASVINLREELTLIYPYFVPGLGLVGVGGNGSAVPRNTPRALAAIHPGSVERILYQQRAIESSSARTADAKSRARHSQQPRNILDCLVDLPWSAKDFKRFQPAVY